MTPDPPSLTTVPDEARGRRTFSGILIAVCLLVVGALGVMLFRTFTRVRPLEEVARTHFSFDSRFTVTHATDGQRKADAWLRTTDPKLTPLQGVQALYAYNGRLTSATPPPWTKSGTAKALRLVATEPGGESFGVEYDTKRRLYHVWWQAAP